MLDLLSSIINNEIKVNLPVNPPTPIFTRHKKKSPSELNKDIISKSIKESNDDATYCGLYQNIE